MTVGLVSSLPADAADSPQVRAIESLKRTTAPATSEWTVETPPFSVEHQVRLSLETRIDWPTVAGSNPWMIVHVNGNVVVEQDLLNKTNTFTLNNGVDLNWHNTGHRWRVLYSPDFKAAVGDEKLAYGVSEDVEPYRFVWDVTRHVRPGENTIRVTHLQVLPAPTTMVLRNVVLEVGRPIQRPGNDVVTAAPVGPLPTFVANGRQRLPLAVQTGPEGRLRLTSRDHMVDIATRISLPGGNWHVPSDGAALSRVDGQATAAWSAGVCRVKRQVTVRDDHVHVADRLTNTGDELLGLMVRHRAEGTQAPTQVLLGGLPAFGERASAKEPPNPSTYARWDDFGVGLVAEDDVFRVHIDSFSDPGGFGIADNSLGIPSGEAVTLEWSVYPTFPGDYWAFVNAVRRNWDMNYEIPGAFVFNGHLKPGQSAEYYGQWMRDRGLRMVCGGIAQYPDDKYAHGTGILHAPQFIASEADWTRKMGQTTGLMPIAYFHCYACTEPDGEKLYADSRMLDGKGEHVVYPYRYPIPLYVPTRENSYGKAIYRYLDTLIDKIGVKGVYWDEMAYSVLRATPHAPWDGCSVRIDPRTHAVGGKLTNLSLLSQGLRADLVDYIRGKGLFLMANTQAHTRTMARLKVVRFVETGTYSGLTNTHLGCPLGLGNHHPEDTQADRARHIRDLLMRGAVYYGHTYYHDPADWDFNAVMYPITPVELHEGVVLGEQRIHTAVSGCFGWPDGAAARVYVVDAEGQRVDDANVREVIDAGGRLYEIRIPSDHFAILVRADAD
ncbi:MAG: hypothetical protein GXY83_09275 [Rhodopirellula sp.]|nr:hypothetical protein [Rhodopirellula sp.]